MTDPRNLVGPPRWPVTLLSGMLGSGKTTVLRYAIKQESMRGTALLINEIGEIGIDHDLIERIDGETVLLRGGCLCCSLRADLPQTLNALRRRWLADETLDLRRVVIETTGLAEPGPILMQLAGNPLIAADFPLESVAVTADAQYGAAQLEARPEARRQIACADRILLTKTDVAAQDATRDLRCSILQVNAAAEVIEVTAGVLNPDRWIGAGVGWQSATQSRFDHRLPSHSPPRIHGSTVIGALSLFADAALNWRAFERCVASIVDIFGADLLRLKGILHVAGVAEPVVIHGVHHIIYPIDHLAVWPNEDRRSRLVLILDGFLSARERIVALLGATGIVWSIAD